MRCLDTLFAASPAFHQFVPVCLARLFRRCGWELRGRGLNYSVLESWKPDFTGIHAYRFRVTMPRSAPGSAVIAPTSPLLPLPMDEPSETIEYTPDDVFRTAIVFEVALGGLAIVLGLTLGPDARLSLPQLDLASLPSIGYGCLYGLLAALPMLVAIEILKRIPWKPIQELEALSDDGMLKTLLRLSPVELLAISLCAGVGEELLFRGWLLSWMAGGSFADAFQARSLNIASLEFWAAMIGSSVAFGMVHPISKLYVVIAALMGMYFAVLLVLSGNLLVPIIAHAAYDAAQLLLTAWQGKRRQKVAT